MDAERAQTLKEILSDEAGRTDLGHGAVILVVGAVLTEMLWGITSELQVIAREITRCRD